MCSQVLKGHDLFESFREIKAATSYAAPLLCTLHAYLPALYFHVNLHKRRPRLSFIYWTFSNGRKTRKRLSTLKLSDMHLPRSWLCAYHPIHNMQLMTFLSTTMFTDTIWSWRSTWWFIATNSALSFDSSHGLDGTLYYFVAPLLQEISIRKFLPILDDTSFTHQGVFCWELSLRPFFQSLWNTYMLISIHLDTLCTSFRHTIKKLK